MSSDEQRGQYRVQDRRGSNTLQAKASGWAGRRSAAAWTTRSATGRIVAQWQRRWRRVCWLARASSIEPETLGLGNYSGTEPECEGLTGEDRFEGIKG